jgi:hypothetical protein
MTGGERAMARLRPLEGNFDAYVFMHLLDPGRDLRGVVRAVGEVAHALPSGFVAQYVGSYTAFARFEVASLDQLQSLIAGDLWKAGVRSDWSTMVQPSRIATPHRGSPAHSAMVRIRTDDPFELLEALDDAFEPRFDLETYFYGAAVINGNHDLLVDICRPSFDELKAALIDDLRTVRGIRSTETSFAFLPGNALSFEDGEEHAF